MSSPLLEFLCLELFYRVSSVFFFTECVRVCQADKDVESFPGARVLVHELAARCDSVNTLAEQTKDGHNALADHTCQLEVDGATKVEALSVVN